MSDQPNQKPEKGNEGDKLRNKADEKSAAENVTDEKQAERYQEAFTSFSDMPGLGNVAPLELENSKTGEMLYDASKNKKPSDNGVQKDTQLPKKEMAHGQQQQQEHGTALDSKSPEFARVPDYLKVPAKPGKNYFADPTPSEIEGLKAIDYTWGNTLEGEAKKGKLRYFRALEREAKALAKQHETEKAGQNPYLMEALEKQAQGGLNAAQNMTPSAMSSYGPKDLIAQHKDTSTLPPPIEQTTNATSATRLQRPGELLLAQSTDRQKHPKEIKPEIEAYGASPSYRQQVQDWWQSVPPDIRNKATHAGVRVIAVNNAKDLIPNADHIPATGHRATGGETIAQQPMFYEPTLRAIIFAEHPDPTGSQQIRQSKGVQEIPQSQFDVKTANHELGHGLDFAVLNHITKSPEFDHAYDNGLAQLSREQRERLHYYTDSPKIRAAQETFAQIYALTHTSPEKLDYADKLLLNKFSKVVDLMKKHGVISKDWEMPKLPK